VKITVKVTPNAKSEEVVEQDTGYLVKVKGPPKDGKANKAVTEILAKHFMVPKDSVRIVSGSTGRNKVIEIIGK
jgi:uncharacterized protein (TIGR00251 family)